MTVNGITFDDPRESFFSKRDFREYKEGARTSVKEAWVCSYTKDGPAVLLERHCLAMTNHGAISLDGRPVKNEDEKKAVAEMFAHLKPE